MEERRLVSGLVGTKESLLKLRALWQVRSFRTLGLQIYRVLFFS